MAKTIQPADLDFSALIRPGDTVLWGQGPGEALTLTESLVEQRKSIGRFTVFNGYSLSHTLQPEHGDCIRMSSYAGVGTNRTLARAGCLDVAPCHYSQVSKLKSPEVVLIHISAKNTKGAHSFGIAHDYLRTAMENARVVIAEVNEQMPWTFDGCTLDKARIDYIVPTSRQLIEYVDDDPTETLKQIADQVSGLVPNGAVLQIGVGTLPAAVMQSLLQHRRLGIHTGLIGDAMVDLVESGALTNETKTTDRGVSVTGLAFGTKRLYDFVRENPAVAFRPPSLTHALNAIARHDIFVSINSAIEVDLTGQVNAEVAGNHYVGAVGGQVDFIRGAAACANGKSIIALPATVARGTASRIVLNTSTVTTSRSDIDSVVTEFGVAHLRGVSLAERAKRMIAIAHPDFREQLAKGARDIAGISA